MFDPKEFIEDSTRMIARKAPQGVVVAAVSGGVDSAVTAALGHRALGGRLVALVIDHGLMREGEPLNVCERFRSMGLNVRLVDARDAFFSALKGQTDPEEKRKAFRETFYQTLAKVAKELDAKYLLQGTIAADIVETKGGVKTQHNVLKQIGISPKSKYGYSVIEPLSELYKDGVRLVAKALKLPPEIIERRPFPGPGLSVRILGEVTPERAETVRKATAIVEEETSHLRCFQSFAVLLNDKATGVTAEGVRKYGEIIVVRIVDSRDAMRAKPTRVTRATFKRITERLLSALPNVSRVLFDLTEKPPATIEFE
jgi:GMP synthase (glutamine-hydrolysing)